MKNSDGHTRVLTSHSVFENLHGFDPLLIGTIPLNIDIEKSDLDIICCWKSKNLFIETLIENFAHHRAFLLTEKKIANHETILATFQIDEFEIEIFGQNRPTKQQEGYRHMMIEHKILSSNDETFRQKIIYLKKARINHRTSFCKTIELSRRSLPGITEVRRTAFKYLKVYHAENLKPLNKFFSGPGTRQLPEKATRVQLQITKSQQSCRRVVEKHIDIARHMRSYPQ